MQTFAAGTYDVIVVGAGHAGIEAALASARLGAQTLLLTLSMENIGLMPCNPSLGGPAKGHLIREIDALGGEMGIAGDSTLLQIRMLNTAKGPAVHALRAQIDKAQYQQYMTWKVENTDKLTVRQAAVTGLILNSSGKITGVKTATGAEVKARAVVLTCGTYLTSKVIVGEYSNAAGPNGLEMVASLTPMLTELGLQVARFKTGTPPRIDKRSVDFAKVVEQWGDKKERRFSFRRPWQARPQMPCWLTNSTMQTKEIIEANIARSPLYSGMIAGTGPRYCPSFEDKIMRFKDKDTHQIFIEPEGLKTNELYVQGLSTSMPEDVQWQMVRSITGLENAEIIRLGYAIEYDYFLPTQLDARLAYKDIPGLFGAGQINGTSGYEEAAAQGLVAGSNAALEVLGKEPLLLNRSEAYIGVLIDDLVMKGVAEPYRMFTALAEYRLLLRNDNADFRLMQLSYQKGMLAEADYQVFSAKAANVEQEIKRLTSTTITPTTEGLNTLLASLGSPIVTTGMQLIELLRRPEIKYQALHSCCPSLQELTEEEKEQVEIEVKYAGYIKKQAEQVARFTKLEKRQLARELDYKLVQGLSNEAREKLMKLRPLSIGQASRVSGISPADINVLLIYLEQEKRKQRDK